LAPRGYTMGVIVLLVAAAALLAGLDG